MPDGNAVRPAEKRECLHEPHDGLLHKDISTKE